MKIWFIHEPGKSIAPPVPAAQMVPPWFRKLPNDAPPELPFHFSAKACMPFVDALTAGYMITLPSAISFQRDGNNALGINWAEPTIQAAVTHHPTQVKGSGWENKVVQFPTFWHCLLPKGYSLLVTHPFAWTELPFHTLTGILDCDVQPIHITPAVLWQEEFEGIRYLDAGTPIAQVIPFRRDNWAHEVTVWSHDDLFESIAPVKYRLSGYKKLRWKRKSFK